MLLIDNVCYKKRIVSVQSFWKNIFKLEKNAFLWNRQNLVLTTSILMSSQKLRK